MKLKILAILPVVTLLCVGSLLGQTSKNMVQKKELSELNGRWMLAILGDKHIKPYRCSLYVELLSKRVGGRSFCNSYFSTIEVITNDSIRFSHTGATRIACPELALEQEYFNGLQNARYYYHKGNNLILQDSVKKVIMAFHRYNPTVADSIPAHDTDTTGSVYYPTLSHDYGIDSVYNALRKATSMNKTNNNKSKTIEKENFFQRIINAVKKWFR